MGIKKVGASLLLAGAVTAGSAGAVATAAGAAVNRTTLSAACKKVPMISLNKLDAAKTAKALEAYAPAAARYVAALKSAESATVGDPKLHTDLVHYV